MIKNAMYTTIITLYKQGTSQRQIAKITNVSRTTVKKIITEYEEGGRETPKLCEKQSVLTEWHEKIIRLLERNLSYVRVYEELQSEGCKASYSALTRYINKNKIKQSTCIRFHTAPGEEAQVDFGDVGKQFDILDELRKAYVFNMRLSYSRLDYYEIVFDQKINTWIKCHVNAFKYFGGVPKIVKIDNLKSGIIDANYYEPIYQNEYKRMADYYGFMIAPCRVYQPQEKGKVESGIKYVKNNFFAGRSFNDNKALVMELSRWVTRANKRRHGTTKQVPEEIYKKEEADCMQKLVVTEYQISSWHKRKVGKDCHIILENNYYSVPAKYYGIEVTVEMSDSLVKIYNAQDELISTHVRVKGQGIFSTDLSHYDKYKRYCPGFREYNEKYEKALKAIGTGAEEVLLKLQKGGGDWHRAAKGIVNLQKTYSNEMIDKACKRALHFGLVSYRKIRDILESNSYDLPLENQGENLCRN